MINSINFAALLAFSLSASVSYATSWAVSPKTSHQRTVNYESQNATDSAITAKIIKLYASEKVLGDKNISMSTLSVETNEGVVLLSGHVASEAQAGNAVKIANSVKGVKKVVFNLKVNQT